MFNINSVEAAYLSDFRFHLFCLICCWLIFFSLQREQNINRHLKKVTYIQEKYKNGQNQWSRMFHCGNSGS